MAYIALKPCSFGGRQFKIGEEIPTGFVLPEMTKRLVGMGKIAERPDAGLSQKAELETEPEKILKNAMRNRKSGGE